MGNLLRAPSVQTFEITDFELKNKTTKLKKSYKF